MAPSIPVILQILHLERQWLENSNDSTWEAQAWWQFFGTVVSAGRHQLEQHRVCGMKAVWSALRMKLEKIRASPAGHYVPRAGPRLSASVLLKGGRGRVQQAAAKPIKTEGTASSWNLTVLSLNYRAGGKISFEQLRSAVSWCELETAANWKEYYYVLIWKTLQSYLLITADSDFIMRF